MSSIRRIMTMPQDALCLPASHTPSKQIISPYFEQIGVISDVLLGLFKQFLLLLPIHVFSNNICSFEICHISKPWPFLYNQQLLIRNFIHYLSFFCSNCFISQSRQMISHLLFTPLLVFNFISNS